MKRLAALLLIGVALLAQAGCDETDYAYSLYDGPGYYTEDVYYEDTYDDYYYEDTYVEDVWYNDWFDWVW